ncbi:hypothetical protein HF257_30940 [Pseudomonas sp. WS 5106]|jgi:hypothetical protein|uniref:Uncharacterized protein n=1 Tax=Pseudomonas cremoris TaxID=2724178 RepID=A0A7X1ATR9_9PSED|nr:hypothetical protein [Pseudomonas cremoris]MBC2380624.1 hypothetical protein [Pseudomonas cremoris]MBC2410447.1 hypothetical protein [Pseudomonas cremoris]
MQDKLSTYMHPLLLNALLWVSGVTLLLMSRDVIERIIGDTSGSSFDLALVLIAYLLLFLLNPMRNWINRRLYKRARRHAARQRLKAGA